MTDLRNQQAPADALNWTFDWTDDLAANGNPTITAATVSVDTPGATASTPSHDDTTVITQLICPGVALGVEVTLTCRVTLSSGESDSKSHKILIEQT